jgi:DNA topoisomerase VI subunit B
MSSKRQLFSEPQVAQYFELQSLGKRVGRPPHDFHRVVVKELIDNSLDAAEAAGVTPEVGVEIIGHKVFLVAHVSDNGNGITPAVLDKLLDFSKFSSDKALYRSPTRGQQGNALKTLMAMPFATEFGNETYVYSGGHKHTIEAGLDEAGLPRVGRESVPYDKHHGTTITVPLNYTHTNQTRGMPGWQILELVRAYHVFNPHAEVSFEHYEPPSEQRVNRQST